MPPTLALSTLNMGYGFENHGDIQVRSPTPVLTCKAKQLLGVGAPPSPHHATSTESRPRGRRLHKMSSNLSLFTDIKNAIANVGSRSASRTETRSPAPFKPRPKPLKLDLELDRRSIASNEDPDYEEPPKSASTLPSYYYKYSPSSPIIDNHPLPSNPTFPLTGKAGTYTKIDQDRIVNNLVTNGMISKQTVDGGTRTSSRQRGSRKNSRGHHRGDSNVSKGSSAGFSAYEQGLADRIPERKSSKGSTAHSPRKTIVSPLIEQAPPPPPTGRQPSAVLPGTAAPDIQVRGIETSEGERVRTWLTHSALSQEEVEEDNQEWLAPERLAPERPLYAADHRYSGSVQTLHSAETGTIFPIQGVPGDWDSIKSHDRQSSVLVDLSHKPQNGKTGKVFYTDLQFESVLALSESDSESDNESVESALYRKRLSMLSNGNETLPTVWSSMPSSRSQSRKMSVTTRATSPHRMSMSSEKANYPIPNAQALTLSRETSTRSRISQDQVVPQANATDDLPIEIMIPELPADTAEQSAPNGSGQKSLSSPMLSPSTGPGPVVLAKLRTDIPARQGSVSSLSTSAISPKSHGPAGPAPVRPLPATPVQAAKDGDKPSIFSFPKPPRVPPPPLGLVRSKSTDLISTSGDSITPSVESSADSVDTVKAAKPATPLIRESTVSSVYSPVESASPQSPSRDLLSPKSAAAGPGSVSIEEFSPIRLAFPDSVRNEMSDQPSTDDDRSITPIPENKEVKSEVKKEGKREKKEIPVTNPTWKRVVSNSSKPSSLPRPALSPKPQAPQLPMPKSQSPLLSSSSTFANISHPANSEGPPAAPAPVVSHDEDAEAEALPQIPVPPIPAPKKPQFHMLKRSDASSMTTMSAPGSATKIEHDLGLSEPGLPIGIARSGSEGANVTGKKRRNGGHESQMRQIRLSRIGNAV